MITLITPTGGRPEAFALCEKWIKQQTYKGPLQWIVIDDCPSNPTQVTLGQDYHKAAFEWKPGINTQRYNMDQALKHVKGDKIFIIEDDDYYSPEYLGTLANLLEYAAIAGISNSKYYHLGIPGYKNMNNYRHSSLANVAIHRSELLLLIESVHSGEYYFDIELYKKIQARGVPSVLISDTDLAIGMKGLPGKTGLGIGHAKKDYFGDADLTILKKWLGSDFRLYLSFVNKGELNADTKRQTNSLRENYREMSERGEVKSRV